MFELAERGYDTPFQQLVACVISIRTRDEESLPISLRLFAAAPAAEDIAALTPDEIDALIRRGVDVVPAVWSDPSVPWTSHDAIVIRSTWDYHLRPSEFGAWIDLLERSGCAVWNPCPLLRWNANKRYLADLEARGVPIVPTAWITAATPVALRDVMDARGWNDVVVKPAEARRQRVANSSAEIARSRSSHSVTGRPVQEGA